MLQLWKKPSVPEQQIIVGSKLFLLLSRVCLQTNKENPFEDFHVRGQKATYMLKPQKETKSQLLPSWLGFLVCLSVLLVFFTYCCKVM